MSLSQNMLLFLSLILLSGVFLFFLIKKAITEKINILNSNEKLKQIIDFLPDATFAIDIEGKVTIWNKAMEDLTKVKADDILGKGNYEYSIPFRNSRKPILIDYVLNPNLTIDECYKDVKINDDGSVIGESYDVNLGIYSWGKASPLYDSEGKIIGAIETIRDITHKIESEKTLLYQKKFFETLFTRTGDAIAIIDKFGIIINANDNFEKLFGYKKEEYIGKDLDSIVTNESKEYLLEAKEITKSSYQKDYFETEGVRFNKEGKPIDMLIKGVTIKIDDEVIGGYAIYSDISSKKKYENELRYLSLHDSLTGLYNRNFFDNKILELQNSDEYPISIISIDVNGLKLINDTLGHLKGDELLVKATQILKRAIDVDLMFRVGGDEFIIILPKTSEEYGEKIIKNIIGQFDEYNSENPDFPVNISLGLSTAKDKNTSLIDIYKRADDYMYKNKLIQKTSPKSQILSTLMSALQERDFITSGHVERVTELCIKMGERIGLTSSELTRLNLLGEVHDLGKVGIPDNILFKEGPLDKEECEIMKQHCEKGYRIALSSPELASIADLILKHHERWDGKGYPLGLKGKEIPIECRILHIVDSYDAMISDRPYRRGMKREEAIKEILSSSGKQFDPELVPIFIEIISKEE